MSTGQSNSEIIGYCGPSEPMLRGSQSAVQGVGGGAERGVCEQGQQGAAAEGAQPRQCAHGDGRRGRFRVRARQHRYHQLLRHPLGSRAVAFPQPVLLLFPLPSLLPWGWKSSSTPLVSVTRMSSRLGNISYIMQSRDA
jgi:hypothetical protein